MTDPRERLMDHALSELLRPRDEVDVSDAVLERIERGERIELEFDPVVDAPVPRRLPRLVPLLVAAAVLAIASVAFLVVTRPDPFATASAPVVVLDASGATLGEASELEAGFLVAATLPVEISREDDTLALASRSIVGVEEGGSRLFLGGVTLAAGGAPARLATDWAEIVLDPNAALRANVTVDGPPGALATLAPADVAAALVRRADGPPFVLTVSLEAGSASLVVGDVTLPLARGETVLVNSGGRVFAPLTPEDELHLVTLFAETRVPDDIGPWYFGSEPFDRLLAALHTLEKELADLPHGWSALLEPARERWEARAGNPYDATMLLVQLSTDAAPASLELARAFWMEDPGYFTTENLIGFAKRGAFEFERELVAIASDPEPESKSDAAHAAAALVFVGNELGLERAQALVADLDDGGRCDPPGLAAAAALEFAGRRGTWDETIAAAGRIVRTALDEGALEKARTIVLYVDWLDGYVDADEDPPLELLEFHLMQHMREHGYQLETADDVLAALAKL